MADENSGYALTLQEVDNILSHKGKHLENFSIVLPQKHGLELLNEDHFLNTNHVALQAQCDKMCEALNEEQQHIFQCILYEINAAENNMFFVEGRPGQGKTFMVSTLTCMLCASHHIILIVGSSALCATAYPHGCTAHYMFGIPATEESTNLHSSIHPFLACAELIHNAYVIIWDELPVANKATWECVDELSSVIL